MVCNALHFMHLYALHNTTCMKILHVFWDVSELSHTIFFGHVTCHEDSRQNVKETVTEIVPHPNAGNA